ncbi:MFS transporter, partial [Streptococcus pneumoniae]|nr:MFS transporter [Streptococcus pneumoniae]
MSTFFLLFFTALFGGSGIYFAKGILGNEGYYAQISSTMALTQLLTLFVAFLPMKYLGKRNTALLGSLIISLGLVVQIFVSDSLAGLVFCSVLKGVGAGFVGAVLYGMVADTIDYGQWK